MCIHYSNPHRLPTPWHTYLGVATLRKSQTRKLKGSSKCLIRNKQTTTHWHAHKLHWRPVHDRFFLSSLTFPCYITRVLFSATALPPSPSISSTHLFSLTALFVCSSAASPTHSLVLLTECFFSPPSPFRPTVCAPCDEVQRCNAAAGVSRAAAAFRCLAAAPAVSSTAERPGTESDCAAAGALMLPCFFLLYTRI